MCRKWSAVRTLRRRYRTPRRRDAERRKRRLEYFLDCSRVCPSVIISPHATAPRPGHMKKRPVGSALADAVSRPSRVRTTRPPRRTLRRCFQSRYSEESTQLGAPARSFGVPQDDGAECLHQPENFRRYSSLPSYLRVSASRRSTQFFVSSSHSDERLNHTRALTPTLSRRTERGSKAVAP